MNIILVTDRKGSHIQRFHDLFKKYSSKIEVLFINNIDNVSTAMKNGENIEGWDKIQQYLESRNASIISGPLDTVSINLAKGSYQHIGISFSSDIMLISKEERSRELMKQCVKNLDGIIVDNIATENAIIALGANEELIIRQAWGPSAHRSWEESKRNKILERETGVIMFPRNLEKHYGPELFVEAFGELCNELEGISAELIEGGSMTNIIKEQIGRMDLEKKVRWLPRMQEEEFNRKMEKALMVVLAPKTDGSSVTMLDAMAMRVPVVTTLNAGSAEWIVDGITGWNYPVGDKEILKQKMKIVVKDIEHRKEVVNNAEKLIRKKGYWDQNKEALIYKLKTLLRKAS